VKLHLNLENRMKGLGLELYYWFRDAWMRPNLYHLESRERLGAAFHEPTDTCAADRIELYPLVRGLRPVRALEIGVRW